MSHLSSAMHLTAHHNGTTFDGFRNTGDGTTRYARAPGLKMLKAQDLGSIMRVACVWSLVSGFSLDLVPRAEAL